MKKALIIFCILLSVSIINISVCASSTNKRNNIPSTEATPKIINESTNNTDKKTKQKPNGYCSADKEKRNSLILAEIKKSIIQFYENKDVGKTNSLKLFDEDLAFYLVGKIDIHQYATSLYKTEKENYSVQVNLIKSDQTDTELFATYQVISFYNYVFCKEQTTVSEEVQIIYNYKKGQITEFYSPLNYYDCAIRSESEKTLSGCPKIKDIELKKAILKQDIDKCYAEESNSFNNNQRN